MANELKKINGLYSPQAVANCFLLLSKRNEIGVTNIKMQKLLYFANGRFLALEGIPLINKEFSAWSYGPVLPELYHMLKVYEDRPIADLLPSEDEVKEGSRASEIISDVWESNKHLSTTELVNMSHVNDSPWSRTWQEGSGYLKMIPTSYINDYFTNLEEKMPEKADDLIMPLSTKISLFPNDLIMPDDTKSITPKKRSSSKNIATIASPETHQDSDKVKSQYNTDDQNFVKEIFPHIQRICSIGLYFFFILMCLVILTRIIDLYYPFISSTSAGIIDSSIIWAVGLIMGVVGQKLGIKLPLPDDQRTPNNKK